MEKLGPQAALARGQKQLLSKQTNIGPTNFCKVLSSTHNSITYYYYTQTAYLRIVLHFQVPCILTQVTTHALHYMKYIQKNPTTPQSF